MIEVDDVDVWREVASNAEEDPENNTEGGDSVLTGVDILIEIKPFKKWRKMISLISIILFVSLLAYLDYVNDYQIMNLINNFQLTKKANAKGIAICPSSGDSDTIPGLTKVEAVVHMVEKDALWALTGFLRFTPESDQIA
mmetsp:Transcript_26886/g.38367  ORF Transcript_26886/g.38367 Transcript_26886/m.38367 type:complete len:140 (+) Transcript_26886:72-491(+)